MATRTMRQHGHGAAATAYNTTRMLPACCQDQEATRPKCRQKTDKDDMQRVGKCQLFVILLQPLWMQGRHASRKSDWHKRKA